MNGSLITDCEAISRIRSGKSMLIGGNGYVIYNIKWKKEHDVNKFGKWEYDEYLGDFICSECGKASYARHNYCPKCGAKME